MKKHKSKQAFMNCGRGHIIPQDVDHDASGLIIGYCSECDVLSVQVVPHECDWRRIPIETTDKIPTGNAKWWCGLCSTVIACPDEVNPHEIYRYGVPASSSDVVHGYGLPVDVFDRLESKTAKLERINLKNQ